MLKQVFYLITRVGELSSIRSATRSANFSIPKSQKYGLPEIHSEDFMPHLKQTFSFEDGPFYQYVSEKEYYRVRMPLRKSNNIETNTKYLGPIISVIGDFVDLKNEDGSKKELDDIKISEFKHNIENILEELASRLYISENKYRYQIEQSERYKLSLKKFKSNSYLFKSSIEDIFNEGDVGTFALEYNEFIWKLTRDSHDNIESKIPYNVIGNYHTNTSKMDKYISYLSFQNSSVKKLIGNVLSSLNNDKKEVNKRI